MPPLQPVASLRNAEEVQSRIQVEGMVNKQLAGLEQHGPGPMLGLTPHAAPKAGPKPASISLVGAGWRAQQDDDP